MVLAPEEIPDPRRSRFRTLASTSEATGFVFSSSNLGGAIRKGLLLSCGSCAVVKVFTRMLPRIGIGGKEAGLSYCLLFRYSHCFVAQRREVSATEEVKAKIIQRFDQRDIHILATFHKKLIFAYSLL